MVIKPTLQQVRQLGSSTPQDCPPPPNKLHSRPYKSPSIAFVTVTKSTNAAQGDVPLNLPFPWRFIMVASRLQANVSDTLFLHYLPLNKSYAGLAITMTGNESWMPLCDTTGNHPCIGMGYLFEHEQPLQMFLDIGQEAGGGPPIPPITFVVADEWIQWNLINQS